MKKMYIAFLFLVIALCVAGTEISYVSAKTDSFITRIEKADELMYKGEYYEAAALCRTVEDEWYNNAKIIDMLLIHDYVDEIGISISQMRTYAESRNTDMYFSESTTAKKELASIKESEYPYFENIL